MTPYTQEVEEALKWAEEPLPPWLNTAGPNYQQQLAEFNHRSRLAALVRSQAEEIAGLKALIAVSAPMSSLAAMTKERDGYKQSYFDAEKMVDHARGLLAAERATVAELRTERERTNQTWRDMRDANLTLLSRAEAAEAKVAALETAASNQRILELSLKTDIAALSKDLARAVAAGKELARLMRYGFWTQITSDIADAVVAVEAISSPEAPSESVPKPCAHHARLYPCGKEGCAECVVVAPDSAAGGKANG